MSYFEDVYLWNYRAGHHLKDQPEINTNDENQEAEHLAMRLVHEEFHELDEAYRHCDLEGIADGCADLVWVVCGLAGSLGIDLDSVWNEVKDTNNAKLGGPRREDGKLMKPEGWKPPDMAKALNGRNLNNLVGKD